MTHYQPQYPPMPPPQPVKAPKAKRTIPLWVFITVLVVGMFTSCMAGVGMGAAGSSQPVAVSEPTDAPRPITGRKATSTVETPAPEPTKTAKPEPKPKPKKHEKLSTREWAQIAKNPDAHIGERVVVHGWVTQFDSATGPDSFLADVGGPKKQPEYGYVDYPTNTAFTGGVGQLEKLVENDLFTAKVTVLGSLDYETQIGGETTVPLLQVDNIKIGGNLPL